MKLHEIQMRDPFVLSDNQSMSYYLYGTTDKDPWKAPGVSFEVYSSTDLHEWDGPFTVFTPPEGFWGTHNFWAPEVHTYQGKYYLFATFTAPGHCRGTHILVSESPMGPFLPVSDEPATPLDWECLDGTFFLDDTAQPWIVFCHEWVQINDGEICARKLSSDLSTPVGDPVLLFRASEASWPKALPRRDGSGLVDAKVTDGPFMYRNSDGNPVNALVQCCTLWVCDGLRKQRKWNDTRVLGNSKQCRWSVVTAVMG